MRLISEGVIFKTTCRRVRGFSVGRRGIKLPRKYQYQISMP